MSVEDAINYSPSEEEDYYALLSCDESSTVRHETYLSRFARWNLHSHCRLIIECNVIFELLTFTFHAFIILREAKFKIWESFSRSNIWSKNVKLCESWKYIFYFSKNLCWDKFRIIKSLFSFLLALLSCEKYLLSNCLCCIFNRTLF